LGESLDPSAAQRLSRLRALLADARRRAGDESELGLHLAILAIDGIGELAIGLCIEHLGIRVKPTDGVPARLSRLLAELKITPPGTKGYGELHKVRNLVQHEGVLPQPEQLPRWLAETEQLADAIVKATFGIGLNEAWSARGVSDARLRSLLEEAERALDRGEAEESFDTSWRAFEEARRRFRQQTGLSDPTIFFGRGHQSIIGMDRDLTALLDEVRSLTEQVEISAFTAEPGEWLWFKQRNGEKGRGLPVDVADAGRAFVFVLAWVLWFESYIARHGVDRWEQWRKEQRAPETGVPGGPHIRGVSPGNRPSAPGGRIEGLRNWIFQLTDVPDTHPTFDWAIHSAVSELEESPLTNAWLDGFGRLSITCPETAPPEVVKASVEELIQAAKTKLSIRALEDAEDEALELKIMERFRVGLEQAACPVKELGVRMPGNKHRVTFDEAEVWIDLPDPPESDHRSWLSKGLAEAFPEHFPDVSKEQKSFESHWRGVFVPAIWNPRRVGAWILDAIAFDEEQRAKEKQEREEAESNEQEAAAALQQLFEQPGELP
jgi:hypothetical protein